MHGIKFTVRTLDAAGLGRVLWRYPLMTARVIAAFELPPHQIGGPGCCSGFGEAVVLGNFQYSPSWV